MGLFIALQIEKGVRDYKTTFELEIFKPYKDAVDALLIIDGYGDKIVSETSEEREEGSEESVTTLEAEPSTMSAPNSTYVPLSQPVPPMAPPVAVNEVEVIQSPNAAIWGRPVEY